MTCFLQLHNKSLLTPTYLCPNSSYRCPAVSVCPGGGGGGLLTLTPRTPLTPMSLSVLVGGGGVVTKSP